LAEETALLAESADNLAALAQAWVIMDWSYIMLGEPKKAQFSRKALKIYQSIGDLAHEANVSTNLGAIAYWAGDWSGALDNYRQCIDASARAGNVLAAAHGEANIGEVLVNQGRCDEARVPLEEAKRTYRATGFSEGVVFTNILLGRMHAIEGDLDESESALKSAIATAGELGIDGWRFEATVHLAETMSRAGRAADAERLLLATRDQTPEDYVDYYAPLFNRVHGTVLDASGRTSEGVAALKSGINLAQERGDDYEHAMLVLTLSRTAAPEVAEETLSAARQVLQNLGVVMVPEISG
jgi:tetratricopeptide (TPR) repeat protein